ncbi:von Willebrand factor type A domain-containing protein [Ornithinimicrobium humiphilum]|uniref:von Willebrand factor type A domain-containing protein n=1 Tax=Ornithinimicrobium humiphilum TaxID=125288 RepID=A0A543KK13_9MICO|nr:von Willebrand factor type A domain-containing protein [Ornithinimicrobium humiphilum]
MGRSVSIVVLVGAILLAVGLGAWWLLGRDGGTGRGTGDGTDPAGTSDGTTATDDARATDDAAPPTCGEVTVWSAPELLPAVEAAAHRAAQASDDCFGYAVVGRETATVASELRDGDRPDAWVPSSTAWAEVARADGVDLEVGETLATTPVLLAGRPEALAGLGELGVSPSSTFAEVVQAYQQAVADGGSDLTLRVGDPRTDPASMALLGATADELGSLSQAGGPGRSLLVLLAQNSLRSDPVSAVRADPATIVPMTEQQLLAAAADGEEVQGLALGSGIGTVTVPLVRVGEAASADAVDALEEQLLSEQGAADLLDLSVRPASGGTPGAEGVPDDLPTDPTDADPEIVIALAQTWAVIAPQSRILTLVDISGSMAAPVEGSTTRIDLTREAAQTALAVVPGQTAIGLWYFATALDGERDHREVVPLRPLDEEVRSGVTQQQVLLAETDGLDATTLTGDTGLHDALWAAYQHMQDDYRPDAISSVLLLTDGVNDDSTGGLSEDEVVDLLTSARERAERPVTVVLIGVGPDVDADALQRLADAAGGESFVLRDPRELPQVFVDVVARRAP